MVINPKEENRNMGELKQKGFYKPGTKIVFDDLLCEFAEKIAKTFSEVKTVTRIDKRTGKSSEKEERKGVSSTQLRRLFDEVKRYERLVVDDKTWGEQKPYIKMIKSKVHYTVARATKKSSDEEKKFYNNLLSFISDGIDLISDKEDLNVFIALFEAVYGFYYERRPDLKN